MNFKVAITIASELRILSFAHTYFNVYYNLNE